VLCKACEKDGLVLRKMDPADRRSFQLSLSQSGNALFQKVYPEYVALVDSLMSLFSDEELERYALASNHIENTLAPDNLASRKSALRVENPQPVSSLIN
jgi:Transcriptional regulators